MRVVSGSLVNPRVVRLNCGHDQKNNTKQIGDTVCCLECPSKRVFRSHLNLHTIQPTRRVVQVW